jgi:hypothetical protein
VKRSLLGFQSCDQNIKAPDASLIGYPGEQAAIVFYFPVDLFALPTHWRLLDMEPTTGSFFTFPKFWAAGQLSNAGISVHFSTLAQCLSLAGCREQRRKIRHHDRQSPQKSAAPRERNMIARQRRFSHRGSEIPQSSVGLERPSSGSRLYAGISRAGDIRKKPWRSACGRFRRARAEAGCASRRTNRGLFGQQKRGGYRPPLSSFGVQELRQMGI